MARPVTHAPGQSPLQFRGSELELSVVATCLRDSSFASAACRLLAPEDIDDPLLALVFQAVRTSVSSGRGTDPVSTASAMQGTWASFAAGGIDGLMKLTEQVAAHAVDPKLAAHRLAALEEQVRVKRIARAAHQLVNITRPNVQPREALARAESIARSIVMWAASPSSSMTNEQVYSEAVRVIERKGPAKKAITTGIHSLDAALSGGILPGELVLLAGRTKMGKSAVAGHIAISAMRAGSPVLIATLEMPPWQWYTRWVASLTGIPYRRLVSEDLTGDEMASVRKAMDFIRPMPAVWISSPATWVADIEAAVLTAMPAGENPGLVVIDHIGLLWDVVSGRDPVKDIGDVAKRLRSVANRAGVGVLALSQLSREVERNPGRRPQLHHLRASGELEQDADKVLLLYRDSYYYRPGTPIDRRTGEPARNGGADTYVVLPDAAEIIVAANRTGPQTTVPIRFVPETMLVSDWQ